MSYNKNYSGISFSGLLAVAFIVLKLMHYIDWSWWFVLSPLWAPFAIVLTFGAAALFVWLIIKVFSSILNFIS
jgi:hypothetical protein